MNQHLLVHDYDEAAHQAQQTIEQAKVIQEVVSSDVSCLRLTSIINTRVLLCSRPNLRLVFSRFFDIRGNLIFPLVR